MLKARVTFIIPGEVVTDEYGTHSTSGTTLDRWAAVDWTHGSKAMREGALDAYDTVMVRCMWNQQITRDCRLLIDEKEYRIESFHSDRQANTIQITASELQS